MMHIPTIQQGGITVHHPDWYQKFHFSSSWCEWRRKIQIIWEGLELIIDSSLTSKKMVVSLMNWRWWNYQDESPILNPLIREKSTALDKRRLKASATIIKSVRDRGAPCLSPWDPLKKFLGDLLMITEKWDEDMHQSKGTIFCWNICKRGQNAENSNPPCSKLSPIQAYRWYLSDRICDENQYTHEQ